jgi:ERCC4-type nuclease
MIVDIREQGLRPLLNCATKQLPVGDIWIGTTEEDIAENGVILERKTVADLEASILDSRYREQRSRMISYASEKKASVAYIIEGSLERGPAVRLQKKALLKHITRLCLRYHIAVFYTSSVQETADLCTCIHEQWLEDKTTFQQPTTMTYIETRGNTRQANTDDPVVFAVSVLSCCRGISKSAATALLQSLGSLQAVFKATKEELANIKIGDKKFGAVKANRLHSLLSTERLTFTGQDTPLFLQED